MKRMSLIIAILTTLVSFAILAENVVKAEAKRRRDGIPSGGYLELPNKGNKLQVINLNGVCPTDLFQKAVENVRKVLHYPFDCSSTNIMSKLNKEVAAYVVIVEKPNQPMIICAPEEYYSEVNISSLAYDSPNNFIFQRRLEKAILRGFGYAFGCGNSSVTPCIMNHIDSVKDLDKLRLTLGPESLGKVLRGAQKRGCQARKYVSYRKACKEGWAPAPTNGIQKAIWNKERASKLINQKIQTESSLSVIEMK